MSKFDNKEKKFCVCWDITSFCNENCKFCYKNVSSDESFENNILIIEKLIEAGVNKISFVGGEPLLYKDLFRLIKYGRQKSKDNVEFSITTNATLLCKFNETSFEINKELSDKISKNFDWITFSLSSVLQSEESIMGRNENHVKRVINIINSNLFSTDKIKINTLVTKFNLNNLELLADVIIDLGVRRWKLMKFLGTRGAAEQNKKFFEISDSRFATLSNNLLSLYGGKIKITVDKSDDFQTYINLTSLGDVIIFDGRNYVNKGNLLKDDCRIFIPQKHQSKRFDFTIV